MAGSKGAALTAHSARLRCQSPIQCMLLLPFAAPVVLQLRLRLLHNQPKQCLLEEQRRAWEQQKQQQDQLRWLEGRQLTHTSSGIPVQADARSAPSPVPSSSSPWLPESPKAGQVGYFSDAAPGTLSASTRQSSSPGAGMLHRLGSAAAALAADAEAKQQSSGGGETHVLQKLIAGQLGLLPTEEGKQMLHYVIPQVSTARLPGLGNQGPMQFPPCLKAAACMQHTVEGSRARCATPGH